MSTVLIAYGTTEGQTASVAEFMADILRAHGHEVRCAEVRALGPTGTDGCDAALVGAPVHVGKHDKRVVQFVRTHRGWLDHVPSGFFSVSLAATGDEAQARTYVEEFEEATGWRPQRVSRVAGALPYTRYGFVKRMLMKRIAGSKPGTLSTDTSRDHSYTDWDEVRAFTDGFAEALPASA